LNSFGYGRPAVEQYVAKLVATLYTAGIAPEHVLVENLDLNRNANPAFRE